MGIISAVIKKAKNATKKKKARKKKIKKRDLVNLNHAKIQQQSRDQALETSEASSVKGAIRSLTKLASVVQNNRKRNEGQAGSKASKQEMTKTIHSRGKGRNIGKSMVKRLALRKRKIKKTRTKRR